MKLAQLLTEDNTLCDVLLAREIINTGEGDQYQDFLAKLRDRYGEEYSAEVHKIVNKSNQTS